MHLQFSEMHLPCRSPAAFAICNRTVGFRKLRTVSFQPHGRFLKPHGRFLELATDPPAQQHTFACSVCKALPVLFANRVFTTVADRPTNHQAVPQGTALQASLRFRVSRCTYAETKKIADERSDLTSVKKLQREASGFPPHFRIGLLPHPVS